MRCVNHPEREAEMLCSDCSSPLCSECVIPVGDQYFCQPCLEKRVMLGKEAIDSHTGGSKSRFLAFVLSLMPGVGYMYLGLMKRGLETMILFFGTIFVSSLTHIDELVPFVLPVLVFYSIFDTQRLVGQMNDGYPVVDRQMFDWDRLASRSTIIAYGLIGLGILALVNNVVPWVFHYYVLADRVIAPLLILGLGVFILYRNTRKGGNQNGT